MNSMNFPLRNKCLLIFNNEVRKKFFKKVNISGNELDRGQHFSTNIQVTSTETKFQMGSLYGLLLKTI